MTTHQPILVSSQHSLSTPSSTILSSHTINAPYQPSSSTHPFNPPHQRTLSTHPLNTLSTHPIYIYYPYNLSIHLINPSYSTPSPPPPPFRYQDPMLDLSPPKEPKKTITVRIEDYAIPLQAYARVITRMEMLMVPPMVMARREFVAIVDKLYRG